MPIAFVYNSIIQRAVIKFLFPDPVCRRRQTEMGPSQSIAINCVNRMQLPFNATQ